MTTSLGQAIAAPIVVRIAGRDWSLGLIRLVDSSAADTALHAKAHRAAAEAAAGIADKDVAERVRKEELARQLSDQNFISRAMEVLWIAAKRESRDLTRSEFEDSMPISAANEVAAAVEALVAASNPEAPPKSGESKSD